MKLQSYIFLVIGLGFINLGLISHNSGWLSSFEPYTVNMEFLQLSQSPDNNRIVLENKHDQAMYWHLIGPAKQQGFASTNYLNACIYQMESTCLPLAQVLSTKRLYGNLNNKN